MDTSVYPMGNGGYCPTLIPNSVGGESALKAESYAFGRYACNPPYRLLKSLLFHLQAQDPNPDFIVITGDIAPHGMPDDTRKITANDTLASLCQTKLHVMRTMAREFRKTFPSTVYAFTMGNNDY